MSEASLEDIETRLSAARTRLILDKPFLGALVLRLPMQAADPSWCATTGTDARKFYYNPDYVAELRPDEAQFVLAHEALHCALSHFARREHRVKHRWDIACDYAINPILVDEGLTPPPGSLLLQEYRGMTAEEIYPLIEDNDLSETLDQHLYDKQDQTSEGGQDQQRSPLDEKDLQSKSGAGGQSKDERSESGNNPTSDSNQGDGGKPQQQADNNTGDAPGRDPDEQGTQAESRPENNHDDVQSEAPEPLTETEKSDLQVQWQQRLAGAAQLAQQAGKLAEGMARMIDFFLQPTLPWRALLARHMNSIARDDYSYTRPSSRRGEPAIYPSLRSQQMNVVVAVDVSGSIHQDELSEFIAEVDSLKSQVRARVTLMTCDNRLTGDCPWVFEAWEHCQLPERFIGGGGTDFRPVFDWIERYDQRPDLVIYFTDAQGHFPELEANYPVVWLVKGKESVPWGQRIQLN
jgi:predicted metal-dependent peptidase